MLLRTTTALAALTIALIALAGCETSFQTRPTSELPSGVQGIWQSNGYGYVLDVTQGYPRLFHYTPEFCIEDTETATILSHYLKPSNLTYSLDGSAFYFAPTLEPYSVELISISKLPQTCGFKLATDPVTVFDSFVSYMGTHYAFFDLYGVDWEQAVTEHRKRISLHMTDGELIDVLSELIAPLKDGHLSIEAQVSGKEVVINPGRSSVGDALARIATRDGIDKKDLNNSMMKQYWMSGIKKDILKGKGKMVADEWIQYGLVSGDIGYIAIVAEAGYAGKGIYFEEADLAVLQDTLDDVISAFNDASAKAVIIDLSINFGGYDFVSREIAGRFANENTLAYTKYAADSPNQTPYGVFVEPHPGERYTGPVVLVTSNVTVSAGEMLTMALRSQSNIIHVGEATRGAHSDVLTKSLPNGWKLNLSNEVYHDHEGNFWEGTGIPPHAPLQIFNPDNPFEGHVDAIKSIITRINEGGFDG